MACYYDHVLVIGIHHLETILREFLRHYHEARPHEALGQLPPRPREPLEVRPGAGARINEVVRVDRLGGLIHEYLRAA